MDTFTITQLQQKTTSTNKPFLRVTLTDAKGVVHEGVAIWSSFPGFAVLAVGSPVMGNLEDKGKGKTLQPTGGAPRQGGSNAAAMGVIVEQKNQNIRENMSHKETGIKIAGAMRDSALIVTTLYQDLIMQIPEEQRAEKIKEELTNWRTWLMDEWDGEERTARGETAF